MTQFVKTKIYKPKKIYYNINFDNIKRYLRVLYSNSKDYGSMFVIYTDNYTVSINDIGRIEIYYNKKEDYIADNTINKITNIFQNEKSEFRLTEDRYINKNIERSSNNINEMKAVSKA